MCNNPILVKNGSMSFELVTINRPLIERIWFPFSYAEAGLGFTQQWWYRTPVYPDSNATFLRAFEDGSEIARIELNPSFSIDHYANVPALGSDAVEISFFEVHDRHRYRGIGTMAIGLMQDLFPHRRFVAFSEDADGFWASLGWSQYLHADPEEARFFRPLFIQPYTNVPMDERVFWH